MRSVWPILVALSAGVVWGQAPNYNAAGIVKASDYSAGPFAPNSVLSIFGTNLAWSERALAGSDIANNTLPTTLGGVAVYIDNRPVPMLYAAPGQINFIIPGNEIEGDVPAYVVREGVRGPTVTIMLASAAPALFSMDGGFAIATHGLWPAVTPDAPAQGGEIVVVYATGLGKSVPNPGPGVVPLTAAYLLWDSTMQVYLDGVAVDPIHIKYAGVTPGSAGLYQINLELPDKVGPDPEILVSVAGQMSAAGLRLAVR